MTNPQKAKGSLWERVVRDFLRATGWPFAERIYGAGRRGDKGDIDGVPGFLVECKDHRTLRLSEWLDAAEAKVDSHYANAVLVVKRARRPVAEAYVVMTLGTFAAIHADTLTETEEA